MTTFFIGGSRIKYEMDEYMIHKVYLSESWLHMVFASCVTSYFVKLMKNKMLTLDE
jgi:hypothetical protein